MSEKVPLFRYSWEEAKRNKAEQDWRLSQNENYRCARDIEKAINENFDGKHLNGDCVKPVLEQYGFNRVMWVLAATLKEQSHDGRFSPENKSWSDTFYIPKEKGRREYEVRSHPAVLDGFINRVREEWNKLNLFERKHCIKGSSADMDYEGKVLVLNPYTLADEYHTPEDQLLLATSGFGCNPSSLGRKVFGTHLNDGERGTYMRHDFLGVIQDEYLPEWARERLNELCQPQTEETCGMGMKQN